MDDEMSKLVGLHMLKNEGRNQLVIYAYKLSREFPGNQLGLVIIDIDIDHLRNSNDPSKKDFLAIFESEEDLDSVRKVSIEEIFATKVVGSSVLTESLTGINMENGFLPKHVVTCSLSGFGLFRLDGSIGNDNLQATLIDQSSHDLLKGRVSEDDLTVLIKEVDSAPFGFDGLAEGVEALLRDNAEVLIGDAPRRTSRGIQKK